MKTFKIVSRLLAVLGLSMMFVSNGWGAISLPNTDTFTNSTSSWSSGTNVTGNTQLQITGDTSSSKTYDFGVANANKQVTIKFDFWLDGGWENSGGNMDNLNIDANSYVTTLNYGDGSTSPVIGTIDPITATLDGSGRLTLTINPDVTAAGEDLRIDNVVIAAITTTTTSGGRNFALRKDIKLYGDVEVLGNTVLCIKSNGVCVEPTDTSSNASTTLDKAPASYANLAFPSGVSGGNVKWARLYWQGRTAANSSSTFSTIWSTTAQTSARTIKIKKESTGTLSTLTADFADFAVTGSTNSVGVYSASADVTSFVKSGGAGNYYIDTTSFFTETGKTNDKSPSDGLGAYGAWTLVVVYADPATTVFKDIAVFDGYKIVADLDGDHVADANEIVEFNVTGFYTPKAPATVNSKVYAFTGEGDAYITGDKFWMRGGKQATYTELGTFDSRIDVTATRSPSLTNNNGIDIQTYNIGTAGGSGIIGSDETTAWLKFTTIQDTFFPSLAVFSTDLYVPDICYDYSFSQNNRFFPHDTSAIAHIHGSLLNTEPLSTQIMFKNRAAGTEAKNIRLYIKDMNSTSQLEFYTDSTLALQKTNPNSYYYNNVPSGDILTWTPADLTFNWVTGTNILGYNESVFSAFKLRPLVSAEIDVPLEMYVDYDYTLGGQTYSMTNIALDARIRRCVAAPTAYNPVEWIFNVIDSGLNSGTIAAGATNVKYNLPTQVANRPADIKVVSFDPNQLDRVKAISGMVAIELIDVGGYLDTASSCADPNSAITKRAWLQLGDIDANVTSATLRVSDFGTGLNTGVGATEFFKNVRENVAYRVSYNVADDNGSIKFNALTSGGETRYHLDNFPTYGGGVCAVDMDGNLNNTDTVPHYCGDNGTSFASAMTGAETRACMECIYGLKTKSVCSRDNFSIRPEGFDIKIKDPTGLVPIAFDANLSAGYLYQFDVNSTNHIDGNATSGYSAWFDGANPDQNCSLKWEPNGQIDSGCNDTTNPSLQFYFANGQIVAQTQKYDNVGRLKFSMRDTSWTKVDRWPIVHHDNATNWILNASDCASGDGVPLYNSAGTFAANMVGCEISSQHMKLSSPTAQYSDYNLTFKPYRFSMQSFSHGVGKTASTVPVGGGFVYDSNLGNDGDMNMSVRSTGVIRAEAFGGGEVSNFVTECFAKDLNVTMSHSASLALATPFVARAIFQDANDTSVQTFDSGKISLTSGGKIAVVEDTYFTKNGRGSVSSVMRFNFDRNMTTPLNPQVVHYTDINVTCVAGGECSRQASGVMADANGTSNMNFDVTHGYGRYIPTNVKTYGNKAFNELGYMEVWNSTSPLTINGTVQLPSRLAPNWFVNNFHDDTNLGEASVGIIEGTLNPTIPTAPAYSNGDVTFAIPAQTVVPARARVHVNTEGWLWHDSVGTGAYVDPFAGNTVVQCANHPCFSIDVRPVMGRAGSAESGVDKNAKSTTTDTSGWHSTSDYAPAIR